jgi:hypothetical protein
MSAYKDAVTIETDTSGPRLALAAEVLTSGAGVVLLEGLVALRHAGRELLCEVVDPMPSAHRCAYEYEVLVENARHALEASRLNPLLPNLPRTWLVVADYGTGTSELWRAPAHG